MRKQNRKPGRKTVVPPKPAEIDPVEVAHDLGYNERAIQELTGSVKSLHDKVDEVIGLLKDVMTEAKCEAKHSRERQIVKLVLGALVAGVAIRELAWPVVSHWLGIAG